MTRRRKTCPGCGGPMAGTSSRCLRCALAELRQLRVYPEPKPTRDTCPGCGGTKTIRARRCATCQRAEIRRDATGVAAPADLIRTIDHPRAVRSDWRPDHLPPACATCRGFGHVQVYDEATHRTLFHRCGDCAAHPGSSMTHAAWTAARP